MRFYQQYILLRKRKPEGLGKSVYNHLISCSFQTWKELRSVCLLLPQNKQPCEDFGCLSEAVESFAFWDKGYLDIWILLGILGKT